MQVEVIVPDTDGLISGREEVWVRVLSKEGDYDRNVLNRVPPAALNQLSPTDQEFVKSYNRVLAYHPDLFAEDHDDNPEHGFDHEDWFVLTERY